jgi:hypothetical protein
MKSFLRFFRFPLGFIAFVGGGLVAFAFMANAAVEASKTSAAAKPAAKAVEVAPVVLQAAPSVFIWDPKEKGFGKDPFYPETTRFQPPKPKVLIPVATPSGTNTDHVIPPPPPKPEVSLTLQGVIGRKIAIINGKNFMVGDEALVVTPSGRIRIRCESIEAESVTVTVLFDDKTTEKKELSLLRR